MNKKISFTVAAILPLLLTGCLSTEPEEIDKGVEVSADDVRKVLDIAIGKESIDNVKKGEFVKVSQNSIISTQRRRTVLTQGIEVSEKKIMNNELHLTLVEQVFDTGDEQQKNYIREHFLQIPQGTTTPKNNVEDSVKQSIRNYVFRQILPADIVANIKAKQFISERYYNLRSVRKSEAPPAQIKNSSNCRGLNPCQLDVTEVSFEVDLEDANKKTHRLKIYLKIASNVPYLARETMSCREFTVRVNLGTEEKPQYKSVPIKQCRMLEDFRFGS